MSATLLHAHETDDFSVPFNQRFADMGPLFNEIVFRNIERAVEHVNADITRAIRHGAPQETIAELQSPRHITHAVRRSFPPTLSLIDDIERLTNTRQAREEYPGLVLTYKPFSTIYNHSSFVLDPRQIFKLWRASTVRIGNTYAGTDKIGHFLTKGYINYDLYQREMADHGNDARARQRVIELGIGDHFFYSERRMVGYFSSGVFCHADLVADYGGFLFYLNVTEDVQLLDQTRPAMLQRDGDGWTIAPHVRPDTDFFTAYVSNHWDEVLNPNLLEPMMRSAVRRAIEKRACRVLEWYSDELGNRRSRAWFESTMHDFATYGGIDYGHEQRWDDMVTVANTCLAPFDFDSNPDGLSPRGKTALHQAAEQGNMDRLMQLLAEGVQVNAPVQSKEIWSSHWGDTPLHVAAAEGHLHAVAALIDAGAEVQRANVHGVTPLHRAVRNLPVLELLLKHGADVDAMDDRARTPLHWAAAYGESEAVARLIAAGATLDHRDHRGKTALHYTATFGRDDAAAILLDHGTAIDASAELALTPLHMAVRENHLALVKMLLERGADVAAQDEFGCTPLHDAAGRNRLDIARMLLDADAPSAARDAFGCTPLHEAARQGHSHLTALLLEYGGAVTDRNHAGRTALHEAAARGRTATVQLLQSHGGAMDQPDRHGQTAAQLADNAPPTLADRFMRLGTIR